MRFIVLGIAWKYPVSSRYVGPTVYLDTHTQLVGDSDVLWFMSSESPCSRQEQTVVASSASEDTVPKPRHKCWALGTILWFCLVEHGNT